MGTEILRFAQDDTRRPILLSSPEEPMVQYVGINALSPRPYAIGSILASFIVEAAVIYVKRNRNPSGIMRYRIIQVGIVLICFWRISWLRAHRIKQLYKNIQKNSFR